MVHAPSYVCSQQVLWSVAKILHQGGPTFLNLDVLDELLQ